MINGTFKWFNDRKGFGFIEQVDGRMCLFIIQQSTQAVLEASMKAIEFPLT